MIDRFADGDRSNNAPADAPSEANDRENPRGFHGGDLRGIINKLPYLKDLGVTALWLTPWHDNWNGLNRCDKPWCPNTYYHGYHAIDYYAVEDRFGDLADSAGTGSRGPCVGHKDHSGPGSEPCRLATSLGQRSTTRKLVSWHARQTRTQPVSEQRVAFAAREFDSSFATCWMVGSATIFPT